MPNEPPDDLDRELFEPVLVELYRKELSELAKDSCRNRLAEMTEGSLEGSRSPFLRPAQGIKAR